MDKRLLAKIEPIERHAHACGWETARNEQVIDGCPAVQLVGTQRWGNPDAGFIDFGFSVAFCIKWETGRASAMRLDGKSNAVFVMVVEDGTGRYWHGALSAHKKALESPGWWTGVEPGAACKVCDEPLEDGACTNPTCSEWRFGEDFDQAVERVQQRP